MNILKPLRLFDPIELHRVPIGYSLRTRSTGEQPLRSASAIRGHERELCGAYELECAACAVAGKRKEAEVLL